MGWLTPLGSRAMLSLQGERWSISPWEAAKTTSAARARSLSHRGDWSGQSRSQS